MCEKTLRNTACICFSVQGLECLQSLEHLNLYYNNISSLLEITRLQTLPRLRELDLRLNPLTRNESDYRLFTVCRLRNLEKLGERGSHAALWISEEMWCFFSVPFSSPCPLGVVWEKCFYFYLFKAIVINNYIAPSVFMMLYPENTTSKILKTIDNITKGNLKVLSPLQRLSGVLNIIFFSCLPRQPCNMIALKTRFICFAPILWTTKVCRKKELTCKSTSLHSRLFLLKPIPSAFTTASLSFTVFCKCIQVALCCLCLVGVWIQAALGILRSVCVTSPLHFSSPMSKLNSTALSIFTEAVWVKGDFIPEYLHLGEQQGIVKLETWFLLLLFPIWNWTSCHS